MNRIITPTWEADDGPTDNLVSVSCFLGNSISGEELSVDTLDALVDDRIGEGMTEFITADEEEFETSDSEIFDVLPYLTILIKDEIEGYNYGDPVLYYHNDDLIGKFYFSSIERVGIHQYEVKCISGIGLLENSQHYGGIYTGQKMEEVLSDIIGGIIPYELDPVFNNVKVYGWLPVGTRRDNLHQLLFAEGASIKKNAEGDIQISYISDDISIDIPDNRVFIGGSIDFTAPATKVTVNEHSFAISSQDETKTLFEGSVPGNSIITPNGTAAEGVIIIFDEPMHNLSVENGSIIESGVNYAVLGYASNCKLTGKKYTHTVRQVMRPEPSISARALVEQKDNEITVTDSTLVSLVNSENVADRMFAYYGSAQTTNVDIIMDKERPGDNVTFIDPFEKRTSGYIKSMSVKASSILKATAEMIEGYVPKAIGNQYTHRVILRRDSTDTHFIVPEGTTSKKARLVIIGDGSGGQSGEAGEQGEGAAWDNTLTGGSGGKGGRGGNGGQGGNIYVVSIPISPGDEISITRIFSSGGKGGDRSFNGINEGEVGKDITVTVFRDGYTRSETYTSASGSPSIIGYTDPIDGTVYALPGGNGDSGCDGSGKDGDGPAFLYPDGTIMCNPGKNGATSKLTSSQYGWTAEAMGGFGGGAARPKGSSGSGVYAGKGENGETDVNGSYGYATGGKGGDGKDAQDAANVLSNPTSYYTGTIGTGGKGGHGGGGGGGGGGAKHTSSRYSNGGSGGKGGSGGAGSAGVPGGCLIYY